MPGRIRSTAPCISGGGMMIEANSNVFAVIAPVQAVKDYFEILKIAEASREKQGVRSASVAAKQYMPTGFAGL